MENLWRKLHLYLVNGKVLYLQMMLGLKNGVLWLPSVKQCKRLVEASLDVSAAIPAVGNNLVRQQWHQLIQDIGIPVANVIHPSAIISPSAKIGRGVTIMAGCIIGVETYIDDGVIVNMGTAIDHDVKIGQFAHLSVGVKVGGEKK